MASPRAVRIPRSRSPTSTEPGPPGEATPIAARSLSDDRPNAGGFQRAFRLTVIFVVALAVLYAGFVLYDRTVPGGTSSATENGILVLTGLFVVFLAGGAFYTLTPAPRSIEVRTDGVTVVGRWGQRRVLPPLERLSVVVVRRYAAGWLSQREVELIELSGPGIARRSYVVEANLFAGANPSPLGRGRS